MFSRDAVLRQDPPIDPHVTATPQVGDDGTANADVRRSGVVVQLLVPLFVVCAMDFLDVVRVHDDQDLVSNLLAG